MSQLRNEQNLLLQEVASITRRDQVDSKFPEIIGRSDIMVNVLDLVAKVSRSDSAVLIRGESGTGKELVARAIHRLSNRADKPFIALNCSAIPDTLLESELFGHEKGAFTSADRRHLGVFERAHGGTLFLDEIGDMAMGLQAKLLRVLQEKTFTTVGGSELKKADVRIITATNVNLIHAMEKGIFRSDLYYRINVLPIDLPALRERKEDILPLLKYFLEAANRIHPNQEASYFSDEVLATLLAHDWPGNVRQLQNLVERVVVLSGGGRIDISHLPSDVLKSRSNMQGSKMLDSISHQRNSAEEPKIQGAVPMDMRSSIRLPKDLGVLPSEGVNLSSFIEDLENNLIMQALERTSNNRNQAAKLLGMNRTTLVERLKKRRIEPQSAS